MTGRSREGRQTIKELQPPQFVRGRKWPAKKPRGSRYFIIEESRLKDYIWYGVLGPGIWTLWEHLQADGRP